MLYSPPKAERDQFSSRKYINFINLMRVEGRFFATLQQLQGI
jgi:hypothetical protein